MSSSCQSSTLAGSVFRGQAVFCVFHDGKNVAFDGFKMVSLVLGIILCDKCGVTMLSAVLWRGTHWR